MSLEKSGAAANTLPRHIAIIMDGNGRWAKRRGLPRTSGHAAGAETFRKIATYCKNIGIEYLTVYAFSTENWKRPEDEINAIMKLLEKYLLEAIDQMERDGVRLKILGDTSRLSPRIKELIRHTDEISARIKNGVQANICLNYGGRDEIVRAVGKWAESGGGEMNEETLSSFLDTAGIPDPDLLIRPGGETRLSNFLLWQMAYAEFYFTPTLWPDFTERDLDAAIEYFNGRDRRYGGIKE